MLKLSVIRFSINCVGDTCSVACFICLNSRLGSQEIHKINEKVHIVCSYFTPGVKRFFVTCVHSLVLLLS